MGSTASALLPISGMSVCRSRNGCRKPALRPRGRNLGDRPLSRDDAIASRTLRDEGTLSGASACLTDSACMGLVQPRSACAAVMLDIMVVLKISHAAGAATGSTCMIPEALNPPGESIDRELPPPFVKIVAQFIAVCSSAKTCEIGENLLSVSDPISRPEERLIHASALVLHQLFNADQCHAYIHTLRWKDRPSSVPGARARTWIRGGHTITAPDANATGATAASAPRFPRI